MKNAIVTMFLLIGFAASGAVLAAGDPAAGKAKAATCAACHGADGNSTNPQWPTLAGQHASYVSKQLREFKASARKNAMMAPMVAPLSDDDVADLAAYYSTQVKRGHVADENALKVVTAGQRLYRGGNTETGVAACMACHGPDGSGNALAVFPALAGQQAAYVALQLRAFRAGERSNDPQGMMQAIARSMTDAEIEAVSAYVAALH